MPVRFDAYHKWLGIPQQEQPPHHYRLLGVQPFESDPDVISYAADQRMGLLKTFATSNYSSLAEDLLNEVARARVCLLNPIKKQSYDGTLRDSLRRAPTELQAPEGFWIPPQNGTTVSLDVTCPHCEETFAYDLASFAQLLPCKRCDKHMRVPSQGEVATTATQFAQKSALNGNRSLVSTSTVGSRTRSPHDARAEAVPFDTNDIAPSWENEPQFHRQQTPPIPEKSIIPRRKIKRRSVLVSLIGITLGGLAGLSAGYLFLCHFDLRYDFLHLIAAEKTITPHQIISEERRSIPHRPHDPEIPRQEAPRLPKRPQNRVPPIVPQPRIQNAPNGLHRNPLPAQPAPQLADPLARLPLRLALPVPEALSEPIRITNVPLGLDNFELAIIDGIDGWNAQLTLTEPVNWKWVVRWMGDKPSDVGTFSIVNNELQFVWSTEPNEKAVAALRNTVLKIGANQHEHFLALRNPKVTVPLTFDLNKNVSRVVCSCGDLPDLNKIRADIVELQDCPKYRIVGAGLLGLKLNDETTLSYTDVHDIATTAA